MNSTILLTLFLVSLGTQTILTIFVSPYWYFFGLPATLTLAVLWSRTE